MRRFVLSISALLISLSSFACPACEKQQPKWLRGISHGAGPQSDWDMVIVWGMVIIVLLTLYFSIKFIIRPGEKSADHIKRLVINHDEYNHH